MFNNREITQTIFNIVIMELKICFHYYLYSVNGIYETLMYVEHANYELQSEYCAVELLCLIVLVKTE